MLMDVYPMPPLAGKKIYFASDFHLGAPSIAHSRRRERHIVEWLEDVSKDAFAIFLVGDIFDFWFEYKKVIPKGFIRFQGKVAELVDRGIEIHFFAGNHDLWIGNYFENELGVMVHKKPIRLKVEGKSFFVGHGNGLGKIGNKTKLLERVFTSSLNKWLFARLHPNLGVSLAQFSSKYNRNKQLGENYTSLSEPDYLLPFCKEMEETNHFDYYVLGHQHIATVIKISQTSTYCNLGAWFTEGNYLTFDGEKIFLKSIKF